MIADPKDFRAFNSRVRIDRQIIGRDSIYGEATQSWQTLATVWAHVAETESAEQQVGPQQQRRINYVIRTRPGSHLAQLDSMCRVIHNGNALQIDSIRQPDPHKRELIIEASRVVDG